MNAPTSRPDRRVQRTRQLLRDALMALIVEKGYDAVAVQDITDRANVARTTFYLHFRDKEDLLLRSMEAVYDDLTARMGQVSPDGLLANGLPAEVVAFEHVAEHAAFYRVMFSSRGVAAFIVRVRRYLASQFVAFARELLPAALQTRLPLEAIAHREAGALIGSISWWLEHDMPYTPEQMARLHYEVGARGLLWATSADAAPPAGES